MAATSRSRSMLRFRADSFVRPPWKHCRPMRCLLATLNTPRMQPWACFGCRDVAVARRSNTHSDARRRHEANGAQEGRPQTPALPPVSVGALRLNRPAVGQLKSAGGSLGEPKSQWRRPCMTGQTHLRRLG